MSCILSAFLFAREQAGAPSNGPGLPPRPIACSDTSDCAKRFQRWYPIR